MHTHTHIQTHTRTRIRTHTHTHTKNLHINWVQTPIINTIFTCKYNICIFKLRTILLNICISSLSFNIEPYTENNTPHLLKSDLYFIHKLNFFFFFLKLLLTYKHFFFLKGPRRYSFFVLTLNLYTWTFIFFYFVLLHLLWLTNFFYSLTLSFSFV